MGTLIVKPKLTTLLNQYPAAAAYSLRRLRRNYTGPVIRVRRSSDNAEQDIGFFGNDLDIAGILSFVGAGYGAVTTWYDQSRSGLDLTQTTASNQPYIVISGALVTISGKPALTKHTGNARISRNDVPLFNNVPGGTISVVGNYPSVLTNSVPNGMFVFLGVGPTGSEGTRFGITPTAGGQTSEGHHVAGRRLDSDIYATVGSSSAITSSPFIQSVSISWGTARVNSWIDGLPDIVNSVFQSAGNTSNTNSSLSLFANSDEILRTYDNTKISEMLIYNSILATLDRRAIELSQSNYYSISIN